VPLNETHRCSPTVTLDKYNGEATRPAYRRPGDYARPGLPCAGTRERMRCSRSFYHYEVKLSLGRLAGLRGESAMIRQAGGPKTRRFPTPIAHPGDCESSSHISFIADRCEQSRGRGHISNHPSPRRCGNRGRIWTLSAVDV